MPQVTFTIIGLVACYRKTVDEFWTFIFPHDGHHQAILTYTDGGVIIPNRPPITLAHKTVEISAEDSTVPMNYATDRFNERVLNLTAQYLHNEGVNKRPGIRTTTVKHARLDSIEERNDRFVTAYQFERPGQPPTNAHLIPYPISCKIEGTIELPAGGKVIIDIVGEQRIEVAEGERFMIDNYCGDCRRDFLKYHNLFMNKEKPEKYCDVVSLPTVEFDEKTNELKTRTGEPPAFCDGVQIGKEPDN